MTDAQRGPEHVVSVKPKRLSHPAGRSLAEFEWRAICTCGMVAGPFDVSQAERWAREHLEIVSGSVRPGASNLGTSVSETTTGSPMAGEESV